MKCLLCNNPSSDHCGSCLKDYCASCFDAHSCSTYPRTNVPTVASLIASNPALLDDTAEAIWSKGENLGSWVIDENEQGGITANAGVENLVYYGNDYYTIAGTSRSPEGHPWPHTVNRVEMEEAKGTELMSMIDAHRRGSNPPKKEVEPEPESEDVSGSTAPSSVIEKIDDNTYDVMSLHRVTHQEVPERIYTKVYTPTRKKAKTKEEEMTQMVYADRVAAIYANIGFYFQFPNTESQKVFIASWLVRNGSCFLRGVPGTGKTTLIEMTAMCLANPIDYSRNNAAAVLDDNGKPRTFKVKYRRGGKWVEGTDSGMPEYDDYTGYQLIAVDRFLKSKFGTLAIVKHNPDKLPTEVLYQTKIMLAKTVVARDGTTLPAGSPVLGTRKSNPPDGKITLYVQNPKGGDPVEYQTYDFEPNTRPIVDAPVKLHNEVNRCSSAVADAILGLMAENQVEYLGQVFASPREGSGSITFLDSNPHLDLYFNQELDPAFRDRVDVSIWFPVPSISQRIQMGRWSERFGGKGPKQIIHRTLNKGKKFFGGIEPLSYQELQEIWDDVEAIQVPMNIQILASVLVHSFGASLKKYNPNYYKQEFTVSEKTKLFETKLREGLAPDFIKPGMSKSDLDDANLRLDAEVKKQMKQLQDSGLLRGVSDTHVDKSLNMYGDIPYSNQMITPEATGEGPGVPGAVAVKTYKFIDELRIPLGDRARQSLLKWVKAYAWLETALKMGKSGKAPAPEDIVPKPEHVLILLPYVVDHRVGLLGVPPSKESVTAKNYLTFSDFVVYNFVPTVNMHLQKYLDIIDSYLKVEEDASHRKDVCWKCFEDMEETQVKKGKATESVYSCPKCGNTQPTVVLSGDYFKVFHQGGTLPLSGEKVQGAYQIWGDEVGYKAASENTNVVLSIIDDMVREYLLSTGKAKPMKKSKAR